MIEVTVALPTWRSQHILWLQLESLCRQKDAPDWELIVYACDFGESAAIANSYAGRLEKAGCVSVVAHTNRKAKLPLGEKWRFIAQEASGSTLVLAASDNYSPYNRLRLSHDAIAGGADWFDCGEGLFYDISTRAEGTWKRQGDQTGLWMATKTEYIAGLEGDGPRAGIDVWIRDQLPAGHKRVSHDRPLDGVHTDGANTISTKRASMYSGDKHRNFIDRTQKVHRILPPEINARLKEM